MNPTTDDGGPAFPMGMLEGPLRGHGPYSQSGMTLRDWFAGMALSGLIHDWCAGDPRRADTCAGAAYTFADAMLAARKEAAQ